MMIVNAALPVSVATGKNCSGSGGVQDLSPEKSLAVQGPQSSCRPTALVKMAVKPFGHLEVCWISRVSLLERVIRVKRWI